MRDRASLVRVLVCMRVDMGARVAVRVSVHGISVVVVSGSIAVGRVSVILVGVICVIAMAGIQMVRVGHIPVILVRRSDAIVVVIAMLHIPEVPVRRVLVRRIEMARAGLVGMITVAG